jgi:vitamin B12 transporter
MFTLAVGLWLSFMLVPADTVYSLPEMTVTATRIETGLETIGHRIERIDRRQIDMTGSRSAADVLARSSSAYIRHYGAGGMASISLRGTGASQSSILLDGRRINDPQLGQLDLTLLPVDILGSVEVMYGAASAVHGSDGIGGAVNLRTDDHRATSAGTVRLGAGEFGERELSGRVSAGDTRRGLMIAGRLESAENDYPYFSRALGQEVRVTGADRDQAAMFGSAHIRSDRSQIRISGLATRSERGIPAGSGLAAYERQLDESLRLWTDVRRTTGRGYLKIGGLVQHADIRYENQLLRIDDLGRTLTMTADLEGGTTRGRWTLLAGSEVGRTTASHPSISRNAAEHRIGIYTQGASQFGRVSVYPSLRLDVYADGNADRNAEVDQDRRSAITPALGFNAEATDRLRLRASAGRSFRMPTFNDRFWMPGGNPGLRPERGWSTDAGAIYSMGASRAEATIFYLDVRDQIVWRPISGTVWSPSNLNRTVSIGFELSGQASLVAGSGRLDTRATYRLADTRDRSDPASARYGMPLSYRPRHVGSASIAWSNHRFELWLGTSAVGRTYTADDRSRWLGSHAPVHLGASAAQDFGPTRLTLSGRAENVFDQRYAVVENRPMPPRHFRISMQIEPSRGN